MTDQTLPIKEAIVLAGGFGTRLQAALPGVAKCLAPVAGRPFLFHVINTLRMQGIERFIFSLGHLAEQVEAYLSEQFPTLDHTCVVETEPLGTGGGIAYALKQASTPHVLVVNGDTLFKANVAGLAQVHFENNAICTLALCSFEKADRYGTVKLDTAHRITAFREKMAGASGNINAGMYLVDVAALQAMHLPEKFSFEKDFLEKYLTTVGLYGCVQEAYFIDIGIPEDFEKANKDLQPAPLDLAQIEPGWTLLLDRDGVLNYDKDGSYIFEPGELNLYANVPEALAYLRQFFTRMVLVTNQRGVGRGLMTKETLDQVHEKLTSEMHAGGAFLDAIFSCTATDNLAACRKPNPGMAYQATQMFPEIDLSKTIMVGNRLSDMAMGKAAGVYTVFLATTHPQTSFPHPDIDLRFNTFTDFAKALGFS